MLCFKNNQTAGTGAPDGGAAGAAEPATQQTLQMCMPYPPECTPRRVAQPAGDVYSRIPHNGRRPIPSPLTPHAEFVLLQPSYWVCAAHSAERRRGDGVASTAGRAGTGEREKVANRPRARNNIKSQHKACSTGGEAGRLSGVGGAGR